MKSKKVYCKDCKYFLKYIPLFDESFRYKCIAPTGKIITNYIFGDYKELINLYVGDKNYPNNKDTNGCKYYKKKFKKLY